MKLLLGSALHADLQQVGELLAGNEEHAEKSIIDALRVVSSSPYMGRLVKGGRRELVIGNEQRFLALYAVNEIDRTVLVLRIRAQREGSYPEADE